MVTDEPKEVAVPIRSSWWKMKCTVVDEDGKYIFRFQGPRKEYQPGDETLRAALSLKLDEEKPSPEVLKFINDFGTLDRHREHEANTALVSIAQSNLSRIRKEMRDPSRYLAREWIDLDEDGRERRMSILRHDEAVVQAELKMEEQRLAQGICESWFTIYRSFRSLQLIYLEWKATGDIQGLAGSLVRLQPRLVKHDDGVVWEFGFISLFDALVGIFAESIVAGRSWKTCPNPNCRKVFMNGKRKYCNDQCREAYHNSRKSGSVGRERSRLYQTLRRRLEDDLIDDATFEKVSKQLNKATTVPALKAIEKQNSEIYKRLKRGPTLDGGPRQYEE